MFQILGLALGVPLTTTEDDGSVQTVGADISDVGSTSSEGIAKVKSKCSTGCGIGIGVGCLAAVILFGFMFVMARRHKRRLHHLWQYRKWQSKQKDLPEKPVPAPPPPTKF
ncbi:hypothetical protein FB645_006153 [Coemansia sp. IMI 203386]|nr:hypothetical protein FB645_006153 [Coemansia sp. IMI 203386]